MSVINPRIKMRHLVAFREAVRLGGVVKAGLALGITQPAVTRTLQELQEIIGKPLFERSGRKLAVTAEGEVLYRFAHNGLTEIGMGLEAIQDVHEPQVITVGALPTASTRIMPQAVKAFIETGPPAKVRVVTGPNDYLLSLLKSGEADFVVGRMAAPEMMMGLTFSHLYSERVVFAVSAGHPLRTVRKVSISDIEAYPVLMPPPGSVIRPLVERMLLAHGVRGFRNEVENVSSSFGRRLTQISDAVWIISEGVVAPDVADGVLALLPIDSGDTSGPVGLTVRGDGAVPGIADRLVQCIKAVVQSFSKPAG